MTFLQKDNWKPGDRIHYAGAVIDEQEVNAILEVINKNNGRDWTIGSKGEKFEYLLSRVGAVKHAVVTNSGSSALLLSMLALNLPPRSLVVIPATCFPTAFNAVIYSGHIPVVVDVDLKTFNIDIAELQIAFSTYPISAVLVELIAGNIPNLDRVREECANYGAKLILDNCDGFGGKYKGRPVESYADVATTSFHAAHIITTGEGGAVFTSDSQVAELVRQYRDWGRQNGSDVPSGFSELPPDYPQRYSFRVMGLNLKMLELQAAMGIVQLGKLEGFMEERTQNFRFLRGNFQRFPQLKVVEVVDGADPCWLSFPIYCKGVNRAHLVKFLETKNVETRPIFAGNIMKHPCIRGVPCETLGPLPNADLILKNGMFLPVSPRNPPDVYDYIVSSIKEAFKCGT